MSGHVTCVKGLHVNAAASKAGAPATAKSLYTPLYHQAQTPSLGLQELGDLRFCYRQEGLKREHETVTHVMKETSHFVTENGELKICSL